MGGGEGLFVLEKVGMPLMKIIIFQRFKYQKNRDVSPSPPHFLMDSPKLYSSMWTYDRIHVCETL